MDVRGIGNGRDVGPKEGSSNLRKHGVDFEDAATVLADPLSTTFPDPDHSQGEHRYITIGTSARGICWLSLMRKRETK